MRDHRRDIVRHLARGGAIRARRDDRDGVNRLDRFAEASRQFRQAREDLVEHGGLAVERKGVGALLHRVRFRLALLPDNVGFRFAGDADRGGAAFGFESQAVLLGAGERLDLLLINLGGPQDGGDQFGLAPLDFRLLHFRLALLADEFDIHLLGDDLLLRDVRLDIVRLVRLRLLRADASARTPPS